MASIHTEPKRRQRRLHKTYAAFISYKHAKSDVFARNLESALKRYAKPIWRAPLRIFRDEGYFVPGKPLSVLIAEALSKSQHLIYLASPEAAASDWVRDELDQWTSDPARLENLIIVLTSGEIEHNSVSKVIDWSRTDALPDLLADRLDSVPLYVDARKFGDIETQSLRNAEFKRELNQIVAKLRGIDPIILSGREERQHRRNRQVATAVAVVVIAALSATALFWREQTVQSRLADANDKLARAQSILRGDAPDLAAATELAADVMKIAPGPAARDVMQEISALMPAELWRHESPRDPSISSVRQILSSTPDGNLVVRRFDKESVQLSAETGEIVGQFQHPSLGMLDPFVGSGGWRPRFDAGSDRVAVRIDGTWRIVNLSNGAVEARLELPDSGIEHSSPAPDTAAFAFNWETQRVAWLTHNDEDAIVHFATMPDLEVERTEEVWRQGSAPQDCACDVFLSATGEMAYVTVNYMEPRTAGIEFVSQVTKLQFSERLGLGFEDNSGLYADFQFPGWGHRARYAALVRAPFSRAGSFLVWARDNYQRFPRRLEGSDGVRQSRFSNDGRFLALIAESSSGDRVSVIDLASGESIATRNFEASYELDDIRFDSSDRVLFVSGAQLDAGVVTDTVWALGLSVTDRYFSARLAPEKNSAVVEEVKFVSNRHLTVARSGFGSGEDSIVAIQDGVEFEPQDDAETAGRVDLDQFISDTNSESFGVAKHVNRSGQPDCSLDAQLGPTEATKLNLRFSDGTRCQQIDASAQLPDGSIFAIAVLGNSSSELQIWKRRSGWYSWSCLVENCQPWRRATSIPLQGQAHTVSFSSNGRWLGVRDGSGAITLLNGQTFRLHQVLTSAAGNFSPSPPSFVFSPDENWIATPLGVSGGPARWRISDDQQIQNLWQRLPVESAAAG